MTTPHQDALMIERYGLEAQAQMLPFFIGFVGVGLPLFFGLGFMSLPTPLVMAYFALILLNGFSFFWLRSRAQEHLYQIESDPSPENIIAGLWTQGSAAGLWAASLLVMSLSTGYFMNTYGFASYLFLMMCAGAAIGIMFFTAPVLIHLLVLGPVAMAGPVLAIYTAKGPLSLQELLAGGLLLGLALAIILNRLFKRLYGLQYAQLRLDQERLKARAKLDLVTQSRMNLLHALSHELKEGLSGLEHHLNRSMTYLQRAPAPRKEVETALAELERLINLLNEGIDNSHLESGVLEFQLKPFDIGPIISNFEARLAPLAAQKGLGLICEITQYEGHPIGDEERVRQVIDHIARNALHYTQSGRVILKVQVHGDKLHVTVIDSGPGLSADEIATAFAPYQRIGRTSLGLPGVGLGLTLAKALAERMNGSIGFESQIDMGSKVWLELPLDKQAILESNDALLDKISPKSNSAPESLRVLLLADEPLRAAQLRHWLESEGHHCLQSTTLTRATRLMETLEIDALVISHHSLEDLWSDNAQKDEAIGLTQWLETFRINKGPIIKLIGYIHDGRHGQSLCSHGIKPLIWPQSKSSLIMALTDPDSSDHPRAKPKAA